MPLDFQRNVPAACPLCGGTDFSQLNSNDRYLMGIKTVGCRTCGLVQTNPRPTTEELSKFYQHDYRHFYQGVSNPDLLYVKEQKKQERQQETYEYLQRFQLVNAKSRVIDVGCSEGTFFAVLRTNGCIGNFCGVEPGDTFRQHAATIPNTVAVSSIEHAVGVFDLASMIHVLEHQADPLAILVTLRSLLSSDGSLYLDVPDANEYDSIDALHIAHLFHFTESTLTNLVQRAGFRVSNIEKYSPVNHPKSIRLVAIPDIENLARPQALSSSSEVATWQRIRSLNVGRKRVRHHLARIPGLKKLYRMLRKTFI